MADVSVEFGAKDTGLENTLKTIQGQLVALDGELKSGTLSFDEINKKMREAAQAEKLHSSLGGTKDQIDALGLSFRKAQPEVTGLGDKSKEMGAKVEQSGKDAQAAGSMFDQSFKKMAAAFAVGNLAAKGFEMVVSAVFKAARAVVDGFSQALDLGARLNALSVRTGETAGQLLVLETAFKNSGIGADQVGTAINKLQNFMADASSGAERQNAAMRKLGITLADLAGKTPTQQMQVFADGLNAIKDPTDRAAAASEIFGDRLGGKLLQVLSDFSSNLEDARGKVGSLEQVMNENAATFDAAGNTIDAIKGKFAAFAAGLLSETIPAVQDLGTSMEQVDAAGLGKQIGEQLNPALEDFTNILSGAIDLVKSLGNAEKNLAEENSALGATYRAVNESLMGFNKMMHDAFTTFTPFGYLMQTLKIRGEELKTSQEEVADAITETGDAAAEAAGQIDELAEANNRLAAEKAKSIQNQIDLNAAIASGNVEEQNRIQGLIDAEKAQERINKLTDEYIKSGLGSEEAKRLASNLVKSEAAAKGVEVSMKRVAGAVREVAVQSGGQSAQLEEQQRRLSGQLETERRILEARASGNEELVKQIKSQERFNKLVDDLMRSGETMGAASAKATEMIQNEIKALEMEAAKRGATTAGGGGGAAPRSMPPSPSKGGSMAEQMRDQLAQTEFLKKIDPGMFNQSVQSAFDNFGKALSEGNVKAAKSQLDRIQQRMERVERDQRIAERMGEVPNFQELRAEAERLNREFKGGKEEFGDWGKIAKMGGEELRDFVDSLQSQTKELEGEGAPSPGDPGAKPKEAPEGQSLMDKLSSAVEAIKLAVEKIEPKLPQQTLA